MNKEAKIYIAGGGGMAGSAIMRCLAAAGYANLLAPGRAQLDLLNQNAVADFLQQEKPEYIFVAAAKVGGIYANSNYPADFIYQNLVIETNVIHAAKQAGVQRLMFLSSSCIYPRDCLQPMREEYLLTGALEPTNEAYAVAKIAGIKMCQSYNAQYGTQYISVMPSNLYGPNDNYNLQNCHVLPALIRKAHEAKTSGQSELVVWGSGQPRREFLYVDDMADACVFLMEHGTSEGVFNIGTGKDITIRELAELVMNVVGFKGGIIFDESKPDGAPRKLLDVSCLLNMGWKVKTTLEEGLTKTYNNFCAGQGR